MGADSVHSSGARGSAERAVASGAGVMPGVPQHRGRYRRSKSRFIVVFCSLAAVAVLSVVFAVYVGAVLMRDVVPIYRGYGLFSPDERLNLLRDESGKILLDEPIVRIGVRNQRIVGEYELKPVTSSAPGASTVSGPAANYFVLDPDTGRLQRDLTPLQVQIIVRDDHVSARMKSPDWWVLFP